MEKLRGAAIPRERDSPAIYKYIKEKKKKARGLANEDFDLALVVVSRS